jgi:DNA-binding SARP family transcriptional activator
MLEIRTFGGLHLFCDGEPIEELTSRKAEALLVYLAVTGTI